ncbi:hypothetical protein, partial [Schlesneria sp.]|uniref:hypothetical protein n=1 Tax=Schlesneria sp. TaxID=2762018 RepID=UPI002EE63606
VGSTPTGASQTEADAGHCPASASVISQGLHPPCRQTAPGGIHTMSPVEIAVTPLAVSSSP